MAWSDDFHGLPKWVWAAGAAIIVLALFLKRGSSTTASTTAATGATDLGANQAAVDQSANQAAASLGAAQATAQGNALTALAAAIASIATTGSTNSATVAADQAAAQANEYQSAQAAGASLNSDYYTALTNEFTAAEQLAGLGVTTQGAVTQTSLNDQAAVLIAQLEHAVTAPATPTTTGSVASAQSPSYYRPAAITPVPYLHPRAAA